ncbi:unnamed protein product [Orchesella dallaii]|uniref:C2H2-type domain-containing protein n=1 Tax=Orchesella dallaii TaxID=48710 RepID=A0ABP1RWT8_9HEXA
MAKFLNSFFRFHKIPYSKLHFDTILNVFVCCKKCIKEWQEFSELYHQWECFKLKLYQKTDKLASLIKASSLDDALVATFKKQFENSVEEESIGDCIQNFREAFLKVCKEMFSASVPKLVFAKLNLDGQSSNEIQNSVSCLEEKENAVQNEFDVGQEIIPNGMEEDLSMGKGEEEEISDNEQDLNSSGSSSNSEAFPEAHDLNSMLLPSSSSAKQSGIKNLKASTDVGNDSFDNVNAGRNISEAASATASQLTGSDLEEGENDLNNIETDLNMDNGEEDMEISDNEQDFSYSESLEALRAAYDENSMSLPGSPAPTQNLEAITDTFNELQDNENADWCCNETVNAIASLFHRTDLEGGEHFPVDMEEEATRHQPQGDCTNPKITDIDLTCYDEMKTSDNEEISDVYDEQVDNINAELDQRDNDPYFEMDLITGQEALFAVATVTDESHIFARQAPFKCPICPGATLKYRNCLVRHMKEVHKRILSYQCCWCDKKLHTVKGFGKHLYWRHGKSFESMDTLLCPQNLRYSCLDVRVEAEERPRQNLTASLSPYETKTDTSSPILLSILGENDEAGGSSSNENNYAHVENLSEEELQVESYVREEHDENLNGERVGQEEQSNNEENSIHVENSPQEELQLDSRTGENQDETLNGEGEEDGEQSSANSDTYNRRENGGSAIPCPGITQNQLREIMYRSLTLSLFGTGENTPSIESHRESHQLLRAHLHDHNYSQPYVNE